MPPLRAKERAQLPNSAFAYIDSRGRRRLPIHDAAHVRNAVRFTRQLRVLGMNDRAVDRVFRTFNVEAFEGSAARMPESRTRTIKTDILARVEGEGAMFVRIEDGRVTDVKLKIYEPPRFFEAFLRGRAFTEAPDITARICGICPVAYQMSAVQAMEQICGVEVDGQLRALRRLLYCGEWIESHALHVFMLHAPDFLGYDSASSWRATSLRWWRRRWS